jgi:hypothetical protein
MTLNEKSAFLRLLADAVVQVRGWSGPAHQQSAEQSLAALGHVNALADLFHNLARYAADDFAGFQTELFWRQFRHYRQRIPELHDFEAAYRSYLHEHTTA